MHVAILYICTGKYSIFWKDFFLKAEKYFLPAAQKEYFVFTDAAHLYADKKIRVHKIYQEKLGWPFDTLKRFEMFLKVEHELEKFEYLFFFNANMRFVDVVDETILPTKEEGLLAVIHPSLYNASPTDFTFETNPVSTAYIEPGTATHYLMGSLNGGITNNYLQLIKECNNNIEEDLRKDIIAAWHDESHLNKYLFGKKIKMLGPEYAYPQDSQLPFKPKIMLLDKAKLGGHEWLRSADKQPVKDIIGYLKLLVKKILGKW
jgi:hypothetical protein